MNLFKYFAGTLFCGSFFLTACSDNNPDAITTADVPTTPSFSVSSCQEVTDPVMSQQLEAAKANISEIFAAIGDNNLENAKVISASNKNAFKSILDKYPSNCEAQLGYAVSIITDLINNKEIKGFIDSVTNKKKFMDLDVEDFNKYLLNADGTKMTDQFQRAVAAAIPSTDSAIIYMKNIVADDKFVCHYTYDDRMLELDRGEFAPAVSALYIVKAILTMAASLNLDFSYNGKYDWLNDINENSDQDSISNETKGIIEKLLSKTSSFSTVYEEWKTRYTNIPKLLDTAITYVQIGLQYGIDEAKNGTATQMNDPYIVGDGEMADVSVSDFKKAIDSLEYYRGALYSGVEITLPKGSKVKINLAKFFEITDGWQDYFPYHEVNDASMWLIPEDGNFYWSESHDYDSFASRYIKNHVEHFYKKQFPNTRDIWSSISGKNSSATLYVELDLFNADNDYLMDEFNVAINNCTVSFIKDTTYKSHSSTIESIPSFNLGPEFCKVENGESLTAQSINYFGYNYFYFTDANGNKTISSQSLAIGHIVNGNVVDYDYDDYKSLIIFPDITFGGILPGMTVENFWNILKTEDF